MSQDEAIFQDEAFERELLRFQAPAPGVAFRERVLSACAAAPRAPVARPNGFRNFAVIFFGLLLGGALAAGPWYVISSRDESSPEANAGVNGAERREAAPPKAPTTPAPLVATPPRAAVPPKAAEPPKPQKKCAYCESVDKVVRDLAGAVHCPCAQEERLCFFCGGIAERSHCSACAASAVGTCADCDAALDEARKTLGGTPSDFDLTRLVLSKRLYCQDQCKNSGKPCQMCDDLRKLLAAWK